MPMEPRGTRRVNRDKLTPEACTDGPFKGYVGLDRINSAALRGTADRFTHLMHHLNESNLRRAIPRGHGAKANGNGQRHQDEYGVDLQANLQRLEDEIRPVACRPPPHREK